MRVVLFLMMLAGPGVCLAQYQYRLTTDVPVTGADGSPLPLAWAGAYNAGQFNTIDLDADSDPDLVVFDRTTNTLLTYLSADGAYHPAPEYASLFPGNLRSWLLLRDFNCDGKKDLFTSDPFGVRVFVNVTASGGQLSWRAYHPGFPLLTQGFSGSINLKINETDIPSIDDIDGDGDLDIINARFVGSGTLEYHQNMNQERTGTCDSMQFVRVTQAWGGFEDCECNTFAFGGNPCPSGGRAEHAGGKALTTLDIDNDGDRDLLFSQEECSRVHLLANTGDAQNAVFTSAVTFPTAQPINFLIFPAVFLEDADFDGKADLIASPNVYSRGFQNINFSSSGRLYKNNGVSSPNFSFSQADFLQDQSVDAGENSVPAFADADGDGDLDLFLSNAGTFDNPATLRYFRNTGNYADPAFRLEDEDYLGLSLASLSDLKLQFADMNRDGRTDLVLTATDFRAGSTSLYYAPNQSDFGLDLGGQSIISTGFVLSSGETPHVTDINRDGYIDVLLSKSSGALQYWENSGNAGTFTWVLKDPSYLGISSGALYSSISLYVSDIDRDGNEDLLMGLSNGSVSILPDFRNADDATLPNEDIVYNPFLEEYGAFNLGGRIWPVAVNLFRESRAAIVIGNSQGGLRMLRDDQAAELPEEPVILVYPNPPAEDRQLHVHSDSPARVQIFSYLGQGLSRPFHLPAFQEGTLNLAGLSQGLYVVRFEVNGKSYSRKVAITP